VVASPQNPRQRRPESAGMAAADYFQDWGGVPEVPKLYGPCRSRRPYARLAIAGWHRPWWVREDRAAARVTAWLQRRPPDTHMCLRRIRAGAAGIEVCGVAYVRAIENERRNTQEVTAASLTCSCGWPPGSSEVILFSAPLQSYSWSIPPLNQPAT
jgi:hypothetical protein